MMCQEYGPENQVLKFVMKSIYAARKPLPLSPKTVTRTETVNGHSSCELWFMTKGCSHDRDGGCTMCNYGKSHSIDKRDVLREIQRSIARFPSDLDELIVTPSGSMLDDEEVAESQRNHILNLFRDKFINRFLLETRADTVSLERLDAIRKRIKAREFCVEIGVENTNEWILRNVVNKNLTRDDIENAIGVVHEAGMKAYANIGIGLPFLNEAQNIKCALQSIQDAFGMGFDNVVFFPYHVKPGTLLEYLWRDNRYHCVSLWSFIDVLRKVSADFSHKVQISWYRNYYTDKSKILESPCTCDNCIHEALAELDNYKNYPGVESLRGLRENNCSCYDSWKDRLHCQPTELDFSEIQRQYEKMAVDFKVPERILRAELDFMKRSMGEDRFSFAF